MVEDDSKEKKAENKNNQTANTVPMMYYYQPFTPPVSYNPQGYPAYPPYPTGYPAYPYPVPYPQMYIPHPTMNTPSLSTSAINNNIVNTSVSIAQQRPVQRNNTNVRPQAPAKPQTQAKPEIKPTSPKTVEPKISFPVQSYNLDDPEKLEKWKAERRKRFPSATKEKAVEEPTAVAEKPEKSDPTSEEEEGALCEEKEETSINSSNNTNSNKRKRICKYFSRGKCNKGDSCVFEHSKEPAAKRNKQGEDSRPSSRPTIFENLLKIEEKERMIKFYECIKLILSHHNNKNKV